jgi:hypothetical protein
MITKQEGEAGEHYFAPTRPYEGLWRIMRMILAWIGKIFQHRGVPMEVPTEVDSEHAE